MKLRIIFSGLFLLILSACGTKKRVVNTKNPEVVISESKPIDLPSVNAIRFTRKLARKNPRLNKKTLSYIRKYAPIAVKEMYAYKIPASITLAQGILESGNGESVLALKSNNHFGIKCHRQWTGERVYHDDDEKGECFRKYQYTETSYNDHSLFLTQRSRYAFLFGYNIKNYKKWAYGLRKAGYATDRQYPSKLIKIIKEYQLYEFDEIKEGRYTREIRKLNKGLNSKKRDVIKKGSYHRVEKGDTLYSISKKYSTSVSNLKALNNLRSTIISIGQKLLLKK
jgi:flagellum-specific peptidoglycan hydrolase FlgJ